MTVDEMMRLNYGCPVSVEDRSGRADAVFVDGAWRWPLRCPACDSIRQVDGCLFQGSDPEWEPFHVDVPAR